MDSIDEGVQKEPRMAMIKAWLQTVPDRGIVNFIFRKIQKAEL